jgi:autotransporter-associated beta strand protein
MKMKLPLFASIIFLVGLSLQATTLYWSADGTNLGGVGTWNTSSTNWGAAPGGPFDLVWTNANVDSAFLDGTAGTITVGTPVTVNTITNNVAGFTFATASSTITFAGADAGVDHTSTATKLTLGLVAGATFTKTGTGRVELANNGNTVGRYSIFGGIISTANSNKWGSATGATNFLVLDGGGGWGIDTTSQSLSPARGIYLNSGGGSLGSFNGTLILTVYGRITGPGSLSFPAPIYSSAATWVLANTTNDYQGSTFVKGGTLRLGASEVLPNATLLQLTTGGSVDLNGFDETVGKVLVNSSTAAITGSTNSLIATNFDLRTSGTISAILAGNANLVKTTTGNVTLNGANTYTGNTTNSAGTITLNGTGRFGNASGVVTLAGGNLTQSANRTVANTLMNPFVMEAATTIQNGSTGTGAILFRHGGTWTTTTGPLTIKNVTSTGAGSFDVVLTNAFTFTQPIVIGASGDSLPCQLSSFNPVGSEQVFAADLSGYGTFRRSVSSGSGGRTIFSVDNTYSGGTAINAGTLLVNNPGPGSGTGSGAVTVGSGGTLGGTGIVAGVVMVNTSGSIAAGDGAGILTLQGGLNLSGGGTNVWELAANKDSSDGTAGTDFDQLSLTASELNLSGSSKLLLKFSGTATVPFSTDPFWQANHTWTIINLSGTAANTTNLPFSLIVNGNFNAGTFSNYVGSGGSIVLTYTTNAPSAPVITSQPPNRSVNAGASATFTVTAFGTDPLSYQWYFQNSSSPIGGATGSSFTKTNAQPLDAGNYFVIVTNTLGTAISSNGVLTVIVPQVTLQPLSGVGTPSVTIAWGSLVGGAYEVQYNTNLGTTNWYILTNVVATTTNSLAFDAPPIGEPARFYRVLIQ